MKKHHQKKQQKENYSKCSQAGYPSVHSEDLALKTAAQYFGEELVPLLGIGKKVLSIAPTELVHLEARQMFQDFNFVMEDGSWAHFEFESDSITEADLKRFREYEAVTSRAYNVSVTTYVVCSSSVKELRSELWEGINVYRVAVIRLKSQNADRLFQALDEKRKRGIAPDRGELVSLLLTPLMDGELTVKDRILKSLDYISDSPKTVTELEYSKMQAVLYALAEKFLRDEDLDQVKERISMTRLGQMLVNDGFEKGIKKGLKQGSELEKLRYSKLILKLTGSGKTDLLIQAASDPKLLEQLYQKYHL